MKNFMTSIECVVEPELIFCKERGETVRIEVKCRSFGKDWSLTRIEEADFLRSYFDLVFDSMRKE